MENRTLIHSIYRNSEQIGSVIRPQITLTNWSRRCVLRRRCQYACLHVLGPRIDGPLEHLDMKLANIKLVNDIAIAPYLHSTLYLVVIMVVVVASRVVSVS